MDVYSFIKASLGEISQTSFKLFWNRKYEECFGLLDHNIRIIGMSSIGMSDLLVWHHCGQMLGKEVWNNTFTLPKPPSKSEIKSLFLYQNEREELTNTTLQNNNGILQQPMIIDKAIHASFIGIQQECEEVIETGTFLGGSAYLFSGSFATVTTIEADRDLFNSASSWLTKSTSNVRCYLGNSNSILDEVLLEESKRKKLFYLDAHYSGGPTSSSFGVSPLLEELRSIVHTVPKYVIVIDDARLIGTDGYPSFEQIFQIVPRNKQCQIRYDQVIII